MAQLVAHLLCKQGVRGSSPLSSTTLTWFKPPHSDSQLTYNSRRVSAVTLTIMTTGTGRGDVFAFRRYEDSSLSYTGIESHQGLRRYGLYDTVVAVDDALA